MPVLPDKHYAATLVEIQSTESANGNFGLHVTFKTDDGNVSRDLWVTQAALDKTRDALAALGATNGQMGDWEWLQNPQSLINGKQVDVKTVTKESQDGTSSWVEVQWINPLRRKASTEKARAAAALLFYTPQRESGSAYGIGGPMPGRTNEPPEPVWGREIADEPPPKF
jgi:hypothetical protein